jgi:hypothetical protein
MSELTYPEILSLLQRISYKPNFNITCVPGSRELGVMLHITMYVPDSTHSHPPVEAREETRYYRDAGRMVTLDRGYRQEICNLIPVSGGRCVPPGLDQDGFLCWLRSVLLELETHELDEWFKIDGAAVNNPHKNDGR